MHDKHYRHVRERSSAAGQLRPHARAQRRIRQLGKTLEIIRRVQFHARRPTQKIRRPLFQKPQAVIVSPDKDIVALVDEEGEMTTEHDIKLRD